MSYWNPQNENHKKNLFYKYVSKNQKKETYLKKKNSDVNGVSEIFVLKYGCVK